MKGNTFSKCCNDPKELRYALNYSQNRISPKVRSSSLTERGLARHAKMLETDQLGMCSKNWKTAISTKPQTPRPLPSRQTMLVMVSIHSTPNQCITLVCNKRATHNLSDVLQAFMHHNNSIVMAISMRYAFLVHCGTHFF